MSLWRKSGRIEPLVSQAITDEILRVLADPRFRLTPTDIEFFLYEEILYWFEIVDVAARSSFMEDDPSDDMFLPCAMDGKADHIISDDEHLLHLKEFPVRLLTPRRFLEIFQGHR